MGPRDTSWLEMRTPSCVTGEAEPGQQAASQLLKPTGSDLGEHSGEDRVPAHPELDRTSLSLALEV